MGDVTGAITAYDDAKIVIMDEVDTPSAVLPQTEVRGDAVGRPHLIRRGYFLDVCSTLKNRSFYG